MIRLSLRFDKRWSLLFYFLVGCPKGGNQVYYIVKYQLGVLIYWRRIGVICEGHMTILISILDLMIRLKWKSMVAAFKKKGASCFTRGSRIEWGWLSWDGDQGLPSQDLFFSRFCSHSSISFRTCMNILNSNSLWSRALRSPTKRRRNWAPFQALTHHHWQGSCYCSYCHLDLGSKVPFRSLWEHECCCSDSLGNGFWCLSLVDHTKDW